MHLLGVFFSVHWICPADWTLCRFMYVFGRVGRRACLHVINWCGSILQFLVPLFVVGFFGLWPRSLLSCTEKLNSQSAVLSLDDDYLSLSLDLFGLTIYLIWCEFRVRNWFNDAVTWELCLTWNEFLLTSLFIGRNWIECTLFLYLSLHTASTRCTDLQPF